MAMNAPHEVTGKISTPAGNLSLKAKLKSLDMSEMLPWFPEDGYIIKGVDDYSALNYLIENAEYTPHYNDIKEFQMVLGDNGIVSAFVPKSPFQSMIMLMGAKTLSLNFYMHQKEFDELYDNIGVLEHFFYVRRKKEETKSDSIALEVPLNKEQGMFVVIQRAHELYDVCPVTTIQYGED